MLTDSDSEDEMDQLKHRYSRRRNSDSEDEMDQLKHRYSRMRNRKTARTRWISSSTGIHACATAKTARARLTS